MNLLRRLKERIVPKLPLSTYQFVFRKDAVGLVYHMVSDEVIPYVRNLYTYKTLEMFEHDLSFLKENCNIISFDQLKAALSGDARLKPGSVLITFDDGYKECFSIVRPLLLRYGIPCTFFITTDFIDNKRAFYRNKVAWCVEKIKTANDDDLMDIISIARQHLGLDLSGREAFIRWLKTLQLAQEDKIDQVGELLELNWGKLVEETRPFMTSKEIETLSADGFTIGAHSCGHPLFNRLSPSQIEEEIVMSCRKISEITGRERIPFAFPFSADGLDWEFIYSLQRKHGFIGPFFDSQGIRSSQPDVINRVWADPHEGSDDKFSNVGPLLLQAYQEYLLADS